MKVSQKIKEIEAKINRLKYYSHILYAKGMRVSYKIKINEINDLKQALKFLKENKNELEREDINLR